MGWEVSVNIRSSLRGECMVCKKFVSGLAFCALSTLTHAAEPSCAGAEYRQFDFWLGAWEVRTADGTLAGRNRITAAEQGCALEERWQGSQGNTGRSTNYYDPVADAWRQLWVSPGVIIDISGGLDDGSMRLEGLITYTTAGEQRQFRGVWTPLDDGRVRQFFEEQRGESGWQPWFEGFYSRSEPDAAAPSVDKSG